MTKSKAFRALGNDRRLQILAWLKAPRAHFREQKDGDLVKDGVCGLLIAEKLGVSQPTVSEHMRILSDAGLVIAKRQKALLIFGGQAATSGSDTLHAKCSTFRTGIPVSCHSTCTAAVAARPEKGHIESRSPTCHRPFIVRLLETGLLSRRSGSFGPI